MGRILGDIFFFHIPQSDTAHFGALFFFGLLLVMLHAGVFVYICALGNLGQAAYLPFWVVDGEMRAA